MRILPARARTPMPWKNGGGVTEEICVSPEGADLASFDWRVSMARIDGDGPFSHFPGIDRTLTILSGEGIAIRQSGQVSRLTPQSAPLAFPGDKPTDARLLGGPVTDLNVMSRRGRVAHRVRPVTAPERWRTADSALLLWITGVGRVRVDDQTWQPAPLDAVLCDGPTAWDVDGPKDCLAYLVTLAPVPG